MGQRASMQQQQSEVARRPRPDLAGTDGGATSRSGRRATIGNNRFSSRSSHRDGDTSSASSASSSTVSSGDDAGGDGMELARRLLVGMGLIEAADDQLQSGSSSRTIVRQHSNGIGALGPSSLPSSSIPPRSSRFMLDQQQASSSGGMRAHRRFGGSERFNRDDGRRHHRRGDGSERLHALLQSIDTMASNSPPTAAQLNKLRHSVPLLQLLGRDIKCPVCHKVVPSDDVEMHLVLCLTRPQLSYNDDILTSNKGECAICLKEMDTGNTIARLPCLCIYHKECIDLWFTRKNTCPEHPGDE